MNKITSEEIYEHFNPTRMKVYEMLAEKETLPVLRRGLERIAEKMQKKYEESTHDSGEFPVIS